MKIKTNYANTPVWREINVKSRIPESLKMLKCGIRNDGMRRFSREDTRSHFHPQPYGFPLFLLIGLRRRKKRIGIRQT